jgi:hypothetical protein
MLGSPPPLSPPYATTQLRHPDPPIASSPPARASQAPLNRGAKHEDHAYVMLTS